MPHIAGLLRAAYCPTASMLAVRERAGGADLRCQWPPGDRGYVPAVCTGGQHLRSVEAGLSKRFVQGQREHLNGYMTPSKELHGPFHDCYVRRQ
jgi:hypothetical protein